MSARLCRFRVISATSTLAISIGFVLHAIRRIAKLVRLIGRIVLIGRVPTQIPCRKLF